MNITTALHSLISGRTRDPSPPKSEVVVPQVVRRKRSFAPKAAARKKHAPIEALPPELLSRIFSFINAPPAIDIKSIASCRLVCRRFLELSSPYLITTVVIAERLPELKKLRQIMDHSYFHKHVTHLMWDASFYEYDLSPHPRRYAQRWRLVAGSTNSSEVEQTRWLDSADATELHRYDPRPHPLEDAAPALEEVPGDTGASGEAPVRPIELNDDAYEDLHALSGHSDYVRSCINQRSCRERGLALRYLHWAFTKLPRLAHVSFADWRALSRYGESFQDVRNRMFSTALPPNFMPGEPEDHTDDPLLFNDFLKEISRIGPKLESFWVGRSNFDTPELGDWDLEDDRAVELQSPLLHDTHFSLGVRPSWQLLGSLRSLRLPVKIRHFDPDNTGLQDMITSHIVQALQLTLPSLIYLELCTSRIPSNDGPGLENCRHQVLSDILGRLKFGKLQSLVLRGWELDMSELGRFIKAHSETLHYIHLIDCECIESYSTAWNIVASSWGPKTVLQGAEVVNVRFTPGPPIDTEPIHICGHSIQTDEDYSPSYTTNGEFDEDTSVTYRRIKGGQSDKAQRDFDLFNRLIHPFDRYDVAAPLDDCDYTVEELMEKPFCHELRLCPGERPDFERAILGKSENGVLRLSRSTRLTRRGEKTTDWAKIPLYPN